MLGKNALIVDDSATARTVLKHKLNQFDVVVESAADGSLALELLRDHQPDIIFLDHIMPGLDGFEVLQRLKSNRSTRGIPVVMYTSQAAPQYTSEAKSLGAIGVIPKQVTNEVLTQILDKAELYHLEAVNSGSHAAEVKATSGADAGTPQASSAAINKATRRPLAVDPAPATARAAESWNASHSGSEPAAAASRHSTIPQETIREESPLKNLWLGMMFALLVVAQGYAMVRDQQQQQVISDLQGRLEQQDQQMQITRDELLAEQRQLTEATWRQVQFVVEFLVEQNAQE